MFWNVWCLAALVCIVAAGAGLLVAAGTMPWPIPLAAGAVALVIAGVARGRRRTRAGARPALLDDTEPAGVRPPPPE